MDEEIPQFDMGQYRGDLSSYPFDNIDQQFDDFGQDATSGGGGGGGSSSPWSLNLSENTRGEMELTFDSTGTSVYIRGTNGFLYNADSEGKPSNIDDTFIITNGQTNYVYLEATWDDSTSKEPGTFQIFVDQDARQLYEIKVDTVSDGLGGTNYVEYQSKSRALLGAVKLETVANELTVTGFDQFASTRLYAELYVVASAVVYLLVP